jgi:hypothetical protein
MFWAAAGQATSGSEIAGETKIPEENSKIEGLKVFELISRIRPDHNHSP